MISIGSSNGLPPVWHQAITWTNADLLSIRTLGTKSSEIWIEIENFHLWKYLFHKVVRELASILSRGGGGGGGGGGSLTQV